MEYDRDNTSRSLVKKITIHVEKGEHKFLPEVGYMYSNSFLWDSKTHDVLNLGIFIF